MARQVIALPADWSRVLNFPSANIDVSGWSSLTTGATTAPPEIDRDLRPSNQTVLLTAIAFGGPNGTRAAGGAGPGDIFLQFSGRENRDNRRDLSSQWETAGRIEITIGSTTWLFAVSGDTTDPYVIDATNAADVLAVHNAISANLAGSLVLDDGSIPTVRVENLNTFFGGMTGGFQHRFIPSGAVEYTDWVAVTDVNGTFALTAGNRYQFRAGNTGTPFPLTGHLASATGGSSLLEPEALVVQGPPTVSPGLKVALGTEVTFTAPAVQGTATGPITRQWQYFRQNAWRDITGETGETYQYSSSSAFTEQVRLEVGRDGEIAYSDGITVEWQVAASAGTPVIGGVPSFGAPEQEPIQLTASSTGGAYDEVEYTWSVIGGGSIETNGQYIPDNLDDADRDPITATLSATYKGTGTNALDGTSATASVDATFEVYGVSRSLITRYALAATEPAAPATTVETPGAPWTLTAEPAPTTSANVYQLDWTRIYHGDGTAPAFARAEGTPTKVADAIPTERVITRFALGFLPPDVPASSVQVPADPWSATEPSPTANEHVWQLDWDRTFVANAFQSATGSLSLKTERTAGATQAIALAAGNYAADSTRKHWLLSSGSYPPIDADLRRDPGTDLFLRVFNLRIDNDRMFINVTTSSTADNTTGGLSDAWRDAGFVIVLAGGMALAINRADPDVTADAVDPYGFTFANDALTAYETFRDALSTSDGAQIATLILDDGVFHRLLTTYALSFLPPAAPASNVETPPTPWVETAPDATATRHVWQLDWLRVYNGTTFRDASGTLSNHALRTGGASQRINLAGSNYLANSLIRRWARSNNNFIPIISGLAASETVLWWLLELRIDNDRLVVDFSTSQTGATDNANLTDEWETGGYTIILAGDKFFSVKAGEDGTAIFGAQGDPYETSFTGTKLAAFRSFRGGLAAGQAGELILDDGVGLGSGRLSVLGDGTVAGIDITTLVLGNDTVSGIPLDTLLLGDGTVAGEEVS